MGGDTKGVVANVNTGSWQAAISLSFDNRHAVVGGRDIVKVIKVAPEGLSEVKNLRVASQKVKLSIMDVAWSPHGGDVAASMATGAVVLWNLEQGAKLAEG
ncbi:unnamed protein product, partial [Discosporangium mesarthrocarpum]